MLMKHSKILLLFLFMIGGPLLSCEEEEFGGSCPDVLPHFKILDLESSHIKLIETNAVSENHGNEPADTRWNEFTLQFKFQVEYIARIRKSNGSSLYALSCIGPGYEGGKIGVESIQIKTLGDYNSSYPKNAIINPIISANTWIYNDDGSAIFNDLNTFITDNKDGIRYEVFEIKLNEAPAESTSFSIELELKMNDGEIFSYTTHPISIIN